MFFIPAYQNNFKKLKKKNFKKNPEIGFQKL